MYAERQKKVYTYLDEKEIDLFILQDFERKRNASLSYLTGMPGDAMLFIFRKGKTILVPWDVLMAEKRASADAVTPYTSFGRIAGRAVKEILARENLNKGRVELTAAMTYPEAFTIMKENPEISFICRENGTDEDILLMRAVKDTKELENYREAAGITNRIIEDLIIQIKKNSITTEADIALHIERVSRELGCEGTGFETLAAGPERSFGIHAVPAYSGASIVKDGFTIVDFGVNLRGYTTDVTLTFVRGETTELQETMIRNVEDAYSLASGKLVPGARVAELSEAVDDFFKERGFSMPHALGHGIGLEAHETPVLKSTTSEEAVLKPGMVIAVEPGLYDKNAGGIRLENDFLITEKGAEALTTSRIVRIPGREEK